MKEENKVTFQEVNQEESEEVSQDKSESNQCSSDRLCAPMICCGIILLIVSSLVLFIISHNNMIWPTGTNIEGSVRFRNNHHKTCNDERYGCCEIYMDCKVKGPRVEYESYKLSRYRILPHDIIKSNCPSLGYLITEYNKHYGNMTTDCGEYGCCPGFNIGCDETIRGTFTEGNNQDTIGELRENSKNMNILIPKENTEGTNCKKDLYLFIDLKTSYEDYYPDKSDSNFFEIFISLIIFGACLVVAGSGTGVRRKR